MPTSVIFGGPMPILKLNPEVFEVSGFTMSINPGMY